VVPKTKENTCWADNEARECAIPPTLSNGFSPGGADGITTDGVARTPSVAGLADEVASIKLDAYICISWADINARHAIA
jgi:hypothetical protein